MRQLQLNKHCYCNLVAIRKAELQRSEIGTGNRERMKDTDGKEINKK